jgi:hypothetical protein
MNHLLAKTKGRDGNYFKIISDEVIFNLPKDLVNPTKYQPDHKLDEDSWFAIDEFSKKEYCIPFLQKKFISTEYVQIKTKDYNNLDFLCAYQTGIYYFQKIGSKQFISKKLLSLNTLSITENEPVIVLNKYADAIYNLKADILYFKSLTLVSTIFKGMEELYREATERETETFLKNDFIKVGEDYSAVKVKKANRKRIAMAMDTLKKFNPKEKKKIFGYIKGYCKDLQFDKKAENFTIETDDHLKQLLYGIEQRFYTTILGGERRLANSITNIDI